MDSAALLADFRNAVHAGLRDTPKTLPCRFFYDQEGSLLFERICELPEYYLTRTEDAILRDRAREIAAQLPPDVQMVELGSGSSRKTRRLIEALLDRQDALRYIPVDISGEMLQQTAQSLAREYPRLEVAPLVAEYTEGMERLQTRPELPTLVVFLGSNLGNFDLREATAFLARMRQMLRPGDRALLGLDLQKDPAILEAAYDDAARVTAQFNLNLLHRINRELGGTFDVGAFWHRAFYNPDEGRVEMHLASVREQTATVDGRTYHFAAGETIHTENSYKFSLEGIDRMAADAGLARTHTWADDDQLFSVHLFGTSEAQR